MKKSLIATLLIGATVLPALQGCFPVVAAGVTTGVMATVDRRSLGVQTDDETIEWKANAQVSEKVGDKAHLNFTSYNRKVLITGEVPSEEAKSEAERIVSGLPNVQGVHNELVVGPASSYTNRSNDAFVTSKIKSRSVRLGQVQPDPRKSRHRSWHVLPARHRYASRGRCGNQRCANDKRRQESRKPDGNHHAGKGPGT